MKPELKDGTATVMAHPNIALVKYWGKRDEGLNLPHTGSISVTLSPMKTVTTVTFEAGLEQDEVRLNGTEADAGTLRGTVKVLDLMRGRAGLLTRARVETENSFPTAAGLASSASGYAALAMAAAAAAGLRLSRQELSVFARRGSGSASRSLHGGFVEWRRGELADGSDSCAVALAPAQHWPLKVLVVVVEAGPKPISSREAMKRTVATSPFYPAWLERVEADLPVAREAIETRSLETLGLMAERNCLSMFATMLGAQPPVIYWRPSTLAVLEKVQALRREGLLGFYTMDAGPNVKVLCTAETASTWRTALELIPGVQSVLECEVGGPAERLA